MCPGLHGNKTTRYLLHRFRCRRHFLFQKDFARFIQNAVVRPAIAEVQTNRELVSFENHVSIYPNSASLFHSRSPFLCAHERVNPWELNASRGDRPSHPIWFGGNAEVLANGNVEYDECGATLLPANNSKVFEVTQASPPVTVWQMNLTGQYAYRAMRIPSLYPGVQW